MDSWAKRRVAVTRITCRSTTASAPRTLLERTATLRMLALSKTHAPRTAFATWMRSSSPFVSVSLASRAKSATKVSFESQVF